jgi:two-component system, NarL family, invasion response regulator UvrY
LESGVIKFLIADDHSFLRSGVIKALSANFPGAEFGEAGNADEILDSIQKARWDLVILDINMPGRNGLDVLKEIRKSNPETRVIIFSMYPEDQFAVRSLKAGASAYLTKDISQNEFVNAIKKLLKGEPYLTPSLMDLITNELHEENNKISHEVLSDREYQVFRLIASGMNVSLIAKKLLLSVKTVSVYRANILKKMNLKNNSEITHYAFKHNLVQI